MDEQRRLAGPGLLQVPEMVLQWANSTSLVSELPDDIGPMIASLLKEDNRWVNAQRIEVSGGQGI